MSCQVQEEPNYVQLSKINLLKVERLWAGTVKKSVFSLKNPK